jgi:hypothetical protein
VNLRHAATLALVGWYVMCPPLCSSSWNKDQASACYRGGFNYDAPLDRWFKAAEAAEFNSLRKCEIGAAEKGPAIVCRCVAADDPRLKGTK